MGFGTVVVNGVVTTGAGDTLGRSVVVETVLGAAGMRASVVGGVLVVALGGIVSTELAADWGSSADAPSTPMVISEPSKQTVTIPAIGVRRSGLGAAVVATANCPCA